MNKVVFSPFSQTGVARQYEKVTVAGEVQRKMDASGKKPTWVMGLAVQNGKRPSGDPRGQRGCPTEAPCKVWRTGQAYTIALESPVSFCI